MNNFVHGVVYWGGTKSKTHRTEDKNGSKFKACFSEMQRRLSKTFRASFSDVICDRDQGEKIM